MAGRPDRSGSVRAGARGRALVLGGGGFLGALYEIGCLRALERRGGPGALDFDFVVGTSGGAVVAALLAAGYRPGELYENARSFSPSELCRLDFRALVRVSARFPYHFLRNLFRGIVRGSSALVEFQEVVQQAVPVGLFQLAPLARFIRHRLEAKGVPDSFQALPGRLYVPAIDLDTGERVVFGDPEHSSANVSAAVAASCAIPRYFQPVSMGDRDFIDGGIGDVLNLDVALERGAGELLAVHPIVAPLNDRRARCLPSRAARCGRLAEQGLVAVLAQAIKISHMHCTDTALRLATLRRPDVRLEVIEPDRLEVELDHPMDVRGRDRVLALGEADGNRFLSRASKSGFFEPRRREMGSPPRPKFVAVGGREVGNSPDPVPEF